MANITATTPEIDLFTRLYTSLRSKALSSQSSISTDALSPETGYVRDFQFFLASPEFERWSSLAKVAYPSLRQNIEYDTNRGRQMAGNPAIGTPTDMGARLDQDYVTTMYVDIDNGSADNSYDYLPANDKEFGTYLKEASIPQNFDLGNFLGAMFGANAEEIPIIPVMAPSEPDVAAASPGGPEINPGASSTLGSFIDKGYLEGSGTDFFNSPDLDTEVSSPLSAALLRDAEEKAAELEAAALNGGINAEPTDLASKGSGPDAGEIVGSILNMSANAAELAAAEGNKTDVIQLAAIDPKDTAVTGDDPTAEASTNKDNTIITTEQAALFWNYQTDIKNEIDPRAFTDPTFFDPNHEMLSYIQADDRYMSYVDAYLETSDLTEAEKQTSRAEALADHEKSIDFLNKVDDEGAFSTAVSASSDNLYDMVERAAPASETQVADLQGDSPRVDIAWVENQLGVTADLPENPDIDLSIATMDPKNAPDDTSTEYYAEMQAQKGADALRLAEEQRIAEAARLEAERAAEEQKAAEERRIAEEQRLREEQNLADELRLAEEQRLASEAELKAAEEKLALLNAGIVEGVVTGHISDPDALPENIPDLHMHMVAEGQTLTSIAVSQLKELGIEKPSRSEIRTAMNNIALLNEDQLNADPASANLINVGDTLIIPSSLEGLTQDISVLDFGALHENMENVRAGTAPLGDPNQQASTNFQRDCTGQLTDPACIKIDFVNGAAGITTLQDLGFITGVPTKPVVADNDDAEIQQSYNSTPPALYR